ncbi:MAG: hypothetical protein JWL63_2679 [Rhodocyclales bacterium]|nr:hypothetical protein [Rhodocyclales bacterium]
MRLLAGENFIRADVRRELRERLLRYLPVPTNISLLSRHGATVISDLDMLRLLNAVTFTWPSELETAKVSWNSSRDTEAPSFEDLITRGILVVSWGRISRKPIRWRSRFSDSLESDSALKRFFNSLYVRSATIDLEKLTGNLRDLGEELNNESVHFNGITCPNPTWVAAQLLQDSPVGTIDDVGVLDEALQHWLDLYLLLGVPQFHASNNLVEHVANRLLAWAEQKLAEDVSLRGWKDERDFQVAVTAVDDVSVENAERYVPPLPEGLFARALWLEEPSVDLFMEGAFDTHMRLNALAMLVLQEIRLSEGGPALNPLAGRIFDLAVERPLLLYWLMLEANSHPALLADGLLSVNLAPIATKTIVDWGVAGVSNERGLYAFQDQTTQGYVVEDAVAVLAYHCSREGVCAAQLADLLVYCHRTGNGRRGSVEHQKQTLRRLLNELLKNSSAPLREQVIAALVSLLQRGRIFNAEFTALLEFSYENSSITDENKAVIVQKYVTCICELPSDLKTSQLTPRMAATLVKMACEISPHDRQQFLSPLDLKGLLNDNARFSDRVQQELQVARALRTHVRTLSRAVAAWQGDVPDDLAEALAQAIAAASCNHFEKGKVAALSGKYEARGVFADGDARMAQDIGHAWEMLSEAQAELLLKAVSRSDEPSFLAGLAVELPQFPRGAIHKRLKELAPEDVGGIWTWPELSLRNDTLLAAGMSDVVTEYLRDDEKRHPKVTPEHAVMRFNTWLRVLLLQERWDEVLSIEIPTDLPTVQAQRARDLLNFQRASAEMLRPNGNLQKAESILEHLVRSDPTTGAYVINLFATRMKLLLGDTPLQRIEPSQRDIAAQLLNEFGDVLAHNAFLTDSDKKALKANRSLLLLVLGRPDEALLGLEELRQGRDDPKLELYAALCIFELGRRNEAIGILDQALARHGPLPFLTETRTQFEAELPAVYVPFVVNTADDKEAVKAALSRLKWLDPVAQAEVLLSSPKSIDDFLIDHFRGAAASLEALAPMLRSPNEDDKKLEDDLSCAVREIINARLHLLGWVASDQSKGGHTAKGVTGGHGGVAERDLVLRGGGMLLSSFEALICTSVNRTTLKSHFTKLFASASCRVLFHVTYSFTTKVSEILSYMEGVARNEAPTDFVFEQLQNLSEELNQPRGFTVTYACDGRHTKVVIIVVDLCQIHARNAVGAPVSS